MLIEIDGTVNNDVIPGTLSSDILVVMVL